MIIDEFNCRNIILLRRSFALSLFHNHGMSSPFTFPFAHIRRASGAFNGKLFQHFDTIFSTILRLSEWDSVAGCWSRGLYYRFKYTAVFSALHISYWFAVRFSTQFHPLHLALFTSESILCGFLFALMKWRRIFIAHWVGPKLNAAMKILANFIQAYNYILRMKSVLEWGMWR